MRLQSISLGLLAIALPQTTLALSLEAVIPAPDSIAYQICETYPEGARIGDLTPCSKARILEDVICKAKIGDEPLHKTLQKHARCLCKSEFFLLKRACHRCVMGHGGMSEQQKNFFDDALHNAHRNFCQVDTPPDIFAKVWLDEVDAPRGDVPAGATALVDTFGTSTDVRLYYTADPSPLDSFSSDSLDASSPSPVATLTPVLKLQVAETTTASPSSPSGNGTSSHLASIGPVTGPESASFNSSLGEAPPANGSFIFQSPHTRENSTEVGGSSCLEINQHLMLPMILMLSAFVVLL